MSDEHFAVGRILPLIPLSERVIAASRAVFPATVDGSEMVVTEAHVHHKVEREHHAPVLAVCAPPGLELDYDSYPMGIGVAA